MACIAQTCYRQQRSVTRCPWSVQSQTQPTSVAVESRPLEREFKAARPPIKSAYVLTMVPDLPHGTQEVVNERPEKPLVFLAEWLLKADKAGGGPGTPGKAEKAAAVSPKADAAKLVAVDQVPQLLRAQNITGRP